MRRARVPRSKATNAFDLLNDVVAVIREEPRRIYMPMWFVHGLDELRKVFGRRKRPACGTAACVAGWVIVLREGIDAMPDDHDDIPGRARQILGITPGEEAGLFNGQVFNDRARLVKPFQPGYADLVIDRIRKFQGRYEDRLRRRTLPVD